VIFLLLAVVAGAFFVSGPLMERNWLPIRHRLVGVGDVGAGHVPAAAPRVVRRTTSRTRVVLTLARREGRRLLLHPVMVAAVLLSAWWGWDSRAASPTDTYNVLTSQFHVLVTVGVLGCLVVHLTVSAPRRDDLEEQFSALPVSDVGRTLALLLGCLAPAGAAVLLAAFTWLAVTVFSDTVLLREPSLWAYASTPVTVLGGLLLGVLLGRWLPWRGAGFPALLLVVVVWLELAGEGRRAYLAPVTERAVYDKIDVYRAGSDAWHVAYIGGLCLMASIGALLRSPGRHRDRLLGLGAVAVLVTAYAGWAQLP